MKKMSTLFLKDPNDLGMVLKEIDPNNMWVFNQGVEVSRKLDGTSSCITGGELHKRFMLKKGRKTPLNSIPCDDIDPNTGKQPYWTLCSRDNKADQYHWEAYDRLEDKKDGTYELCGPKVQGNPEGLEHHILILHGSIAWRKPVLTYDSVKDALVGQDIEGLVFRLGDKYCKIRQSDFGLARGL